MAQQQSVYKLKRKGDVSSRSVKPETASIDERTVLDAYLKLLLLLSTLYSRIKTILA